MEVQCPCLEDLVLQPFSSRQWLLSKLLDPKSALGNLKQGLKGESCMFRDSNQIIFNKVNYNFLNSRNRLLWNQPQKQ